MGHSGAYNVGFFVGLSIPILVVLLIIFIFKKSGKFKGKHEFDERQKLAQGKAYKNGFYTFVICEVIIMLIENTGYIALDITLTMFISMCISIKVFAMTSIIKDAYIGINHTPKSTLTLFLVLAAVNLFFGIRNLVGGEFLQTGEIVYIAWLNLICGITLLMISVALLVKIVQDNKEEE